MIRFWLNGYHVGAPPFSATFHSSVACSHRIEKQSSVGELDRQVESVNGKLCFPSRGDEPGLRIGPTGCVIENASRSALISATTSRYTYKTIVLAIN